MKDFILRCLGCSHSACVYIDKLTDAFGIEITETDVREAAICVCEILQMRPNRPPQLGNDLILLSFERIAEQAKEHYIGYADELQELFGYYVDDYASSLTFNDVEVHNWEELCESIDAWINDKFIS